MASRYEELTKSESAVLRAELLRFLEMYELKTFLDDFIKEVFIGSRNLHWIRIGKRSCNLIIRMC